MPEEAHGIWALAGVAFELFNQGYCSARYETIPNALVIVIPDLIRYPEFTFRGMKLDAGSSPA
jgi:hypothetical protein